MHPHPKDIAIANYRYDLPPDSIAYYPLAERDASKLLVYRTGTLHEDSYRNIASYLPQGSLMVFNNTKVVEARIVFTKSTGGQIEIFCVEPPPEYGGIASALAQTGRVRWNCLIGGASKWKTGQVLSKTIGDLRLEARWVGRSADSFLIELSWEPAALTFGELLHRAGLIPLPPYIHRPPELSDKERYQTVYALQEGSVAAPTAGLHFTEAIFRSLEERGIRQTFVTLHVGAGTFMPVKSATLETHPMHVEAIAVTKAAIDKLRATLRSGRPVIAVGTTSARTLESLYWLGLKALQEPDLEELVVGQWDAYELSATAGVDAALGALLEWLAARGLDELVTSTQLLITPGYSWKIISGLVTNFHQPESTLLLLIAALIGEEWRRLYAHALKHGFRFLSYGDGCLLLP